jgi:hypothetical protein
MWRNLQLAMSLGIAAAALAAAGVAEAGDGSEYSFGLSSREPAAPSGMSIRALYRHPRDPDAKPPPLQEVVLRMPSGLRFDTGTVPACDASDEELRSEGRGACPPGSRVGSGRLTAITGTPGVDPVETDLTLFNGGDELIELVSFRGTDVTAGSDRLKIQGERLVAHPPAVPGGPPDGRTTVREIAFRIESRTVGSGSKRRSFVMTPPSCPAGRQWRSRLTFTFTSYRGSTSVHDGTPCVSRSRAGVTARMRVSIRPRRVRVGKRTRFRVRVHSRSAACRRGVRVRFGGKRARTNRRGRARITLRFARKGRKPVRAAKRGCRSARARVRVR